MTTEFEQPEEFLGRWFLPLTIAVMVCGLVLFIAFDRIGHAFLFATATMAMAIALRLTWDNRRSRGYRRIVTGLFACQALIIWLLGDHANRAAGIVYMNLAFVEGLAMTLLINALTKRT